MSPYSLIRSDNLRVSSVFYGCSGQADFCADVAVGHAGIFEKQSQDLIVLIIKITDPHKKTPSPFPDGVHWHLGVVIV